MDGCEQRKGRLAMAMVECEVEQEGLDHDRLLPQGDSSQLKYLCLKSCNLRPTPNLISRLVSLKSLDLEHVPLNQSCANSILSSCLNLEWLRLKNSILPETLCIHGPSLHLKILIVHECYGVEKFEISSIDLTTFEYIGKVKNFSFLDVPRLEKVHIRFMVAYERGTQYMFNGIANDLPRLRTLSLVLTTDEVLPITARITRFNSLKQLELFVMFLAKENGRLEIKMKGILDELKCLKDHNDFMHDEVATLKEELNVVRQSLLIKEKQRKAFETELLKSKMLVPENHDDFEISIRKDCEGRWSRCIAHVKDHPKIQPYFGWLRAIANLAMNEVPLSSNVSSELTECIHPEFRLAIIGFSESIANLYISEIRCRWLAELLDGTIKLPSIKETGKDVLEWDKYMKRYSDKYYRRSCIGTLHIGTMINSARTWNGTLRGRRDSLPS
ncbi:hypothetical protein LOK49_LG12G02873 [Camellia lanceoleosa]|uniref:Uncharacterized protein n=1 Tax=Camellia lanceoleosa TaxID=1840588 RepID=A0ACC0FX64_9ERIC|nr:hypothetical protein LOK49_LG12G02873 [Camellia lanceoleosa]